MTSTSEFGERRATTHRIYSLRPESRRLRRWAAPALPALASVLGSSAGKQSTELFFSSPHPPRAGASAASSAELRGNGPHHKAPKFAVARPPGGRALPFVAPPIPIRPTWLTPHPFPARRDGKKTRSSPIEDALPAGKPARKPSVLKGLAGHAAAVAPSRIFSRVTLLILSEELG